VLRDETRFELRLAKGRDNPEKIPTLCLDVGRGESLQSGLDGFTERFLFPHNGRDERHDGLLGPITRVLGKGVHIVERRFVL
jgi:hypothetical protein